ncbi:hypothetical protein BDV06DRAFT_232044 [Aspergillus oleicola]
MESLDLNLSSLLAHAPLILFSAIFICFFIIYNTPSPKRITKYEPLNPGPNAKTDAKQAATTPEWTTEHGHGYPPITPLHSPPFNWETENPLVFRSFKPKYHLTMGISPLEYNNLIPMDKTYLERLGLRREVLEDYPDVVRGVDIQPQNPDAVMDGRIKEALCEWYAYVMGVYLPERYPGMFILVNSDGEGVIVEKKGGSKGTMLKSLVTGLSVPIDPEEAMRSISSSSASSSTEKEEDKIKKALLHLLDTLGTWVDEDFLILLPYPNPQPTPSSAQAPPSDQEPKYHLSAYTTYYPAGFDTRTKLGLPLNEIHAPVPGYASKLEKSMDRFFARLEVGRAVVRVNWSIMTRGTGLFAPFGGLHSYKEGEEGAGEKDEYINPSTFDGKETYLRCERQTLHRLPKSKALLFGFHTYTYPLDDIKREGLGEDLATAIEGLRGGSVPEVYGYKRGEYWGEAVKAFLRS